MKNKKVILCAAVLWALCWDGISLAADSSVLDEVIVTADKVKQEDGLLQGGYVYTKGETSFLGKKDTMEVPFSSTNFTEKSLNTFGGPDKPLDSVLVNSPSVRQSGSILHSDFLFRGFRTNGTNMYVNGVPGVLTQFNTPMYLFDKVELLSGPNVGLFGTGVQYESTTPGGVVAAVSKKAPDEGTFSYTQTISGRGLFGEYIDWGQRFGKNKEWGVRIMTENLNGKTAVKGTKMNGQGVFANVDHRSEHTKDNLLIGYRNLDIQKGLRWFMLDSKMTHLPGVPDGANDYGFDGMIKATNGWFMTYNHEQKFNDHWDGFFNFGMQKNDLDKNVMANGGSGYTLKQDGTFKVTSKPGATPQDYYYWQAGTTAHYKTGELSHDITLSYNQAWRNRKTAYGTVMETIGSGTLETGIHQDTFPASDYKTRWNNKTRIKSLSIVDSMTYDKWNFILGVHKHEARSQAYVWNGTKATINTTDTDATSPTYGIVYRPNEDVSIYGSHSENFDTGLTVSSTYENENDVLAPIKTKQNEIGIKYKKNDLLWTLAYYDIKQDNNINVYVDGFTKPFLRQDGELRHKGVEMSVNGKIADKWSIIGAVSRMSAKQEKTQGGTLDGIRENGSSEWTGVLGLQYDPNEAWSILGRAVYTGESPVFNERFYAPGYVVYDLGVSHKTHIGDTPATLSLMCYNVFDKDYWMVSRGNQVYLSTPRTFTFTAQLHF